MNMEVQPWKLCGGKERREMRENVRTNKAKNKNNKMIT